MNTIPRFSNVLKLYPSRPTENLRLFMLPHYLSLIYDAPEKTVFNHYVKPDFRPLSLLETYNFASLAKLRKQERHLFFMAFPQYYPIFKRIKSSLNGFYIFDFHEDHSVQAVEFGEQFNNTKYVKYRNLMLKNSDMVLFTGKRVIDVYRDEGLDMNNPVEIMCAVDPFVIQYVPLNKPEYSVVCSHSISNVKEYEARGVNIVVEGMNEVIKEIPDASLLIIGCKSEDVVKRIRKDANPKLSIRIEGFVPYSSIWEYLSSASICALPLKKTRGGLWNTGTGYKLFEYMAAGRPIVSIEHQGYGEIIQDANCGVQYDGSSEDFAKNVIQLLSDKEKAIQMGVNGRNAVLQKHTWWHRARTISDAIEKLQET